MIRTLLADLADGLLAHAIRLGTTGDRLLGAYVDYLILPLLDAIEWVEERLS